MNAPTADMDVALPQAATEFSFGTPPPVTSSRPFVVSVRDDIGRWHLLYPEPHIMNHVLGNILEHSARSVAGELVGAAA